MKNILLVEDDNSIIMGIQYSLEKEGFFIQTVSSLKEGNEALQDKEYDLILLDINLPDGSGYELCKKIRERSDVGIIFLTACDEEVNVVMGLDIGGDDYITKPFRVRELISRINAVIRRKENKLENLNSILKCGELEINKEGMKVFKNSKEIILTSVEYKLLLMFINNKNIVLTRNIILEKLWDDGGEFVNDNTLSVYIKRLRSKIEDNIKKPKYIVTIRGVGYKWEI